MKKFAKLKPEQQRAIKMLTARDMDFGDGTTKKRMTYEQIAKEIGVSANTLLEWRTQNKEFQDAREEFTETVADEMLQEVYAAIRKGVRQSKPNMKAVELYLKSRGKLKEVNHVTADVNNTITDVSNKTNEDLRKELAELQGKLLDMDTLGDDVE